MKFFRVRSRLLIPGVLGAVLLGIGICLLVLTHTDPATAPEFWVKTAKFGLVRCIAWTSLILGLAMTAAYQVIEYRIYHGWEPKWLEKYVGIFKVLSIEPDELAAPGFSRLEVLRGDQRDWYTLDKSETKLCKPGDTIKLWSVGDQLSRLIVLESYAGPEIAGLSYPTHREVGYRPRMFWAGLTVLTPALAGAWLARAIELGIAREDYVFAHKARRGGFVEAHHDFGDRVNFEIFRGILYAVWLLAPAIWYLLRGTEVSRSDLD